MDANLSAGPGKRVPVDPPAHGSLQTVCERPARMLMAEASNWNGQFFLHHPFNADSLAEVGHADSFAEIYWEDKIMPYVNPTFANEAIAKRGVQIYEEKIFRCLSDTSIVQPYVDATTRQPDGITNRTSYLMNSLLSHKSIRYGRWTFPRFQQEIGTSNFVTFNERDGAVMDANQ